MTDKYTRNLKVGDTGEPVIIQIKNSDGRTDVDLTGATVTFSMFTVNDDSTTTVLIDEASCTLDADPTTGKATYNWSVDDTAVAGSHHGFFKVVFTSGIIEQYPRSGYVEFNVEGVV